MHENRNRTCYPLHFFILRNFLGSIRKLVLFWLFLPLFVVWDFSLVTWRLPEMHEALGWILRTAPEKEF